jgi:hypothetical protein
MDLSVLHAVKSPDRDYTMKDKLNGITSPRGCRFLEWSGWYNQDVSQRLLGHYKLFQLFKAKNKADTQLSLSLEYITHYRTLHVIKYALSCITAVLYCIFTLGDRYHPLFIEEFNKQLINNRQSILQEFLTSAEVDFEKALLDAIEQINGAPKEECPQTVVVQKRLDYKVYNNTFHYLTEYNTNLHTNTTIGITGKEKDVFSKRQILIWLDLQSDLGKMDRIDYSKQNKFEEVAIMLQAINGKTKQSWKEELDKYKDKGPYYYKGEEELKSLINTITNISQIARKAGQRELAKAADRKIRELEIHAQ